MGLEKLGGAPSCRTLAMFINGHLEMRGQGGKRRGSFWNGMTNPRDLLDSFDSEL